MKKLKLYRKSGSPVNLEDREAYAAAWRSFFDKADARAKAKHEGGQFTDQYAILIQRFLRYGERQLVRKFNVEVEVELPKSAAGWKKLMDQYEQVPIMVAVNQKDGSVVGVLMDEQF